MNSTFKHCAVSAAAILAILVPLQALGGTQTANLSVTATIAANCTVSTTPVAFGTYDPIVTNASTALTATGTITITCTTGDTGMTMTLGQGSNPHSGSTAAVPLRQMISGGNYLQYYLYSNAGYSTVWGSTGPSLSTANGSAQVYTVYGSIPAAQNVAAGSYTDTVVATLTF